MVPVIVALMAPVVNSVRNLVVLATSTLTAQDEEPALSSQDNSLVSASVMKAGRELVARYLIAQMIVITEDSVMIPMKYHAVPPVRKAGWALHVMRSALVRRYQWTVVYVSVMITAHMA